MRQESNGAGENGRMDGAYQANRPLVRIHTCRDGHDTGWGLRRRAQIRHRSPHLSPIDHPAPSRPRSSLPSRGTFLCFRRGPWAVGVIKVNQICLENQLHGMQAILAAPGPGSDLHGARQPVKREGI